MPVDPTTFKATLSRWGSGVSVVTTRRPDGSPTGLTATSFASLSLQPPLVLFCLGRDASSYDAFEAAGAFAIHLLGAEQEALANRFAASGGDKFAGLAHEAGLGGVPVLADCLGVLQCRVYARLPGGDHVIVVGEVEQAGVREGPPLLYFRGAYRRLADNAG